MSGLLPGSPRGPSGLWLVLHPLWLIVQGSTGSQRKADWLSDVRAAGAPHSPERPWGPRRKGACRPRAQSNVVSPHGAQSSARNCACQCHGVGKCSAVFTLLDVLPGNTFLLVFVRETETSM